MNRVGAQLAEDGQAVHPLGGRLGAIYEQVWFVKTVGRDRVSGCVVVL